MTLNKRIKDIAGNTYNKLTAESFSHSRNGDAHWKWKCECGNSHIASASNVKKGQTKSCGCNRKGVNKTHGMTDTRLYRIYGNIKDRCNNPNCKDYDNYGGRGIKCYFNNFEDFYDWSIANGYQKSLTIDRIDNDKGYTESNCRWVSLLTQANNKRNNVLIHYNGEKITLREASDITGIGIGTLKSRKYSGWEDSEIMKYGVSGRIKAPVKLKNSILTDELVIRFRKMKEDGSLNQSEEAKKLGVSPATLSMAINKKTWKHI